MVCPKSFTSTAMRLATVPRPKQGIIRLRLIPQFGMSLFAAVICAVQISSYFFSRQSTN